MEDRAKFCIDALCGVLMYGNLGQSLECRSLLRKSSCIFPGAPVTTTIAAHFKAIAEVGEFHSRPSQFYDFVEVKAC